ncbi:phosphotransferase [Streptomyces sp. NPDC057682]|uniref:phosphotransferase n=1 Tax=Streptomyces sp. NPDC057682 TaxID=3346210 RepID=UPI00368BA8D7
MTGAAAGAADEPLAGGMVNAGAVVRRGDLVERPAPRSAPALHAHLRALRERGFDGAPLPAGPVTDGHERLTFLPGDVALPPFPSWAMTEDALRSVGALLRRLHDTSACIPFDTDAPWPGDLSDPRGGPLLCHNDVCPENVVFRDGRAVALIDFDLAAPGRPLWDLAMTALYWAPAVDPATAATAYPAGLDVPRRLRILADGYGLPAPRRAELPLVIEEATAACRAFVARKLADGDPAYTRVWAARGGSWERWDRRQAWLAANRAVFAAALSEGLS